MQWKQLLSTRRYGTNMNTKGSQAVRSEFEKDIDRVIFSESFRRLQNKTQVIPLPEDAFVHNRLTHSLEVSSVGRSLGRMAGTGILEKYPGLADTGIIPEHFGAVVSAAALAHDIGNPPFGHAGEKAISEFYLYGAGKIYREHLDEKQWADLSDFEGNAHGFRLLNQSYSGIPGGIRLTFATLAAFSKYPKESRVTSGYSGAGSKKYGFFQAEKDLFRTVAEETGLIRRKAGNNDLFFARHPLAFLVEAADDICYTVIDLEDGYGMSIIPFKLYETLMIPLCGNILNARRYARIGHEPEKVMYLRAVAINNLVRSLSGIFIENEEGILNGTFDTPLIKRSDLFPATREIISISAARIYNSTTVVEIEMAGFEVISGLLEIFTAAINAVSEGNASYYHKKIVSQLPPECLAAGGDPDNDLYTRLLKVTGYVASMTDAHAIRKYRQLKGIELPNHL